MRLNSISLAVLIFVSSTLTGCLSAANTGVGNAPHLNVQERTYTSTRVFAGECLSGRDGRTGAILAVLGTALISQTIKLGVSAIQSALEEAGQDKIFSRSATANLDGKETPSCIQIVHGEFNLAPQVGAKTEAGRYSTDGWDFLIGIVDQNEIAERFSGAGELVNNPGIFLAKPPKLFVELKIIVSSDKSSFSVTPRFIYFPENISIAASPEERALGVLVSVQSPGLEPKAVGTAALDIGKLIPSATVVDFRADTASNNVVFPHSPWTPLPKFKDQTAWILLASVNEKKEGSPAAAFLAKAIKAKEAELVSALENSVIPAKVKSERAKKLIAEYAGQAALASSFNAAMGSKAALEESRAGGAEQNEIRNLACIAVEKLLTANKVAVENEQDPPFSESEISSHSASCGL